MVYKRIRWIRRRLHWLKKKEAKKMTEKALNWWIRDVSMWNTWINRNSTLIGILSVVTACIIGVLYMFLTIEGFKILSNILWSILILIIIYLIILIYMMLCGINAIKILLKERKVRDSLKWDYSFLILYERMLFNFHGSLLVILNYIKKNYILYFINFPVSIRLLRISNKNFTAPFQYFILNTFRKIL